MPSPEAKPLAARMPVWAKAWLLVLAALFLGQALWAASSDSVTIDEFVHLPVGLNAWQQADYRIDPINPHLPRMIAALPLLLRPPVFSPEPQMGHWGMGYHLMQSNVEDYQALYFAPRGMIAALGLLLGAVVFAWAKELYGWRSGLASASLFALTPSMLAHGHLVTLDMPGALGFTLAMYACWRHLNLPTLGRAAVLGFALGLANLLKLSAFVLTLVVVGLVAWRAIVDRDRSGSVSFWFGQLVVVAVVALATLNLGYAFDGTFAPLTEATLADGGLLASLREVAPWLRLPLPLAVLNGIDMILNVGKVSEPSYFLAGELSAEGWWYYHLAAFALKTPLPLLGLGFWSLALWLAKRDRAPRLYVLWVAVLAIFAANTVFNSLQIGVRHVLVAVPLLLVPSGARLAALLPETRDQLRAASRRPSLVLALGLFVWLGVETFSVGPRYLQYCNQIAGGAEGCHEWLVDSNIDWGQDLRRLRAYIDARELPGVHLAYFGRVNPGVYGIRFAPLTPASRGTAVVSASFLMGRPYFWYVNGRMAWARAETYAWLREHEPIDQIGAMLVYELK